MSRAQRVAIISVLLILAAGFGAWLIRDTLSSGTTTGPDFVRALQSDSISPGSISSIEVVESPVGHAPFTATEYDDLPRKASIEDRSSIDRLLTLLKHSQSGLIYQNHPTVTQRFYLKMNSQRDFYWLYCDVLQDAKSAVLVLNANTQNALNPNGASTYHLEDFAGLLTMVQHNN